MAIFLTIANYFFKFSQHPHCEQFAGTLNNTYAEPFDTPVINIIFIDTGRIDIATDTVANSWTAIINIIDVPS